MLLAHLLHVANKYLLILLLDDNFPTVHPLGYTYLDVIDPDEEKVKTSFADVNIKFRVYQNGNYLFAGSDQSDRDVKENILDITGTSLDKIKQLRPRTFNFIESEGYSTETKTGFIAQEVASVIPSITNGTDGQKDMGVDYNGLVAHLVKALQEATTEIETLKTKVAALEGS